MNLHEYQAKHLLNQYDIPVPHSGLAGSPEEAVGIAKKLGGERWVVKAQIHAGGRGKAGGVCLVNSIKELESSVKSLIGQRLVTFQTDQEGQPIHQVLIESPANIQKEFYCSIVIDRASQRIVLMTSTEGGVEIETLATQNPEKISKIFVDPFVGLQSYQCRQLFLGLALEFALLRDFNRLLLNLYRAFIQSDLSLLEVNPLVLTEENQWICLDAKINIDDNALYRQPELSEMRDPTQEDEREVRAQQWGLNYIALTGDIACMVNGAGLAMATMDLIKLQGGHPANFLDVGGSATRERVTEAFKIIMADQNIKAILVNIFGGIVRCDLIADGIISAITEAGVPVPVVVRLEGNNADLGAEKLSHSNLNIVVADQLAEATRRVVEVAQHPSQAT